MMFKSKSAFIHFLISSVIGLTFLLTGCYDVSYKNKNTGTANDSWWNGLTAREIIEATPLVVKASSTSVKKSSSKIPSASDTVAKTFTIEWSLPAALSLNSLNDFEVSCSSNSTFDDGDDNVITLTGSNFWITDSGDSKNYKLTDTVNTQTVSGDYVIYFQVKMKDSNSEWYKTVVSFVLYPTGKNVRIRTAPVETDAAALNELYHVTDTVDLSQNTLPENSVMLFGNDSLDELYDSANNIVNPEQDTPFILAILTGMSGITGSAAKSAHYSNSSFCRVKPVTPVPDAEATLQYSFEDLPLDRLSFEPADADGVRRFDYNDVVVYVDILPLDNEIGAAAVTAGNGQLILTWNSVKGATSYQAWYSTTNDNSTATQFGGDISGTGCTITGLTAGTKYYVWLKALYVGETGGFGPVSSGTPYYVNTAVSNLKAVIAPKQVTLTWTDPISLQLDYMVVSWTGGVSGHIAPGTQNYNAPVTAKGTPYTFTVTAYFKSGDSYAAAVYTTGEVPISTANELNSIVRGNLDTWFIITADIDLSGYSSGEGWMPIGISYNYPIISFSLFTGRLNGNGYKIRNLSINRTSGPACDDQGLFEGLGSSGSIINLGVININIKGRNFVGGLAGLNNYGAISNCYVTGTVKGNNYVGGLVGENLYVLTMTNCYSSCSVSGNSDVGGVAGRNVQVTISNCYATGAVTGNSNVGGLAGYHSKTKAEKCYAAGAVTGNSGAGGLVGYNDNGIVKNCFYDMETTHQSDTGKGTGLSTSAMKQQSSYSGWDFTAIWNINNSINNGYPYLRSLVP